MRAGPALVVGDMNICAGAYRGSMYTLLGDTMAAAGLGEHPRPPSPDTKRAGTSLCTRKNIHKRQVHFQSLD